MSDPTPAAATRERSMAPFFVIWTGQAFSLIGSRLVSFALVWWLTRETGSATVLAVASMVAMLPQVLLGPFAGALVDRWDRRIVMMVSDGLIALATLGLAALFALQVVEIWHIYLLMAFRSAGGAFQWPAMQASTSLLVPERHLTRVGGMNQMLQGVGNIVAPPLGALLLTLLPTQGVLSIDVLTAVLAIGSLFFVAVPQPVREETEGSAGVRRVLDDLRAGLRFVRDWPALMIAIGMGIAINMLMAPALSLVPLLVTEHFGAGALELGWMQSALGIGMVVGGFTLSIWGGFRRRVVTALAALVLRGLGLALVGLTPGDALAFAIGATFFTHLMTPIIDGSLFAMLQATVPPGMQARVFTLMTSGMGATVPLGLALAGPVADALGVRFWFVIAGLTTMLIGAGGFFLRPLMQMEEQGAAMAKAPAARQVA
jgi:DHA3 family macrolide efflux protein-like MFS transporter